MRINELFFRRDTEKLNASTAIRSIASHRGCLSLMGSEALNKKSTDTKDPNTFIMNRYLTPFVDVRNGIFKVSIPPTFRTNLSEDHIYQIAHAIDADSTVNQHLGPNEVIILSVNREDQASKIQVQVQTQNGRQSYKI